MPRKIRESELGSGGKVELLHECGDYATPYHVTTKLPGYLLVTRKAATIQQAVGLFELAEREALRGANCRFVPEFEEVSQ